MNEIIPHNSNKSNNLPLGWFVLLSFVLHLLLFWGVSLKGDDSLTLPVSQQTASGMHIRLAPYRVAQPQRTVNKAHTRKSVAEPPTQKSTPAENRDAFRTRVISKLRKSLETHFVYPLMARQRNWQGEVLLAFRLERDGSIHDVRVARSSGYGLLDSAALNALSRLGGLGEWLPDSLSVELPIIYRLEG